MEEVRRRRGRPKLDAHITEEDATSRRQALNKMYMYEGVCLLKEAATEIQNSEVLWQEDRKNWALKSRDGILEQLGRMVMRDGIVQKDCVYFANLAIAAVQAGYTTREVEIALRNIRKAARPWLAHFETDLFDRALGITIDRLKRMGGIV